MLDGQCFVWFEGGAVPGEAAGFLMNRGLSSVRSAQGLIVQFGALSVRPEPPPYSIAPDAARDLLMVVLLPATERAAMLRKIFDAAGPERFLALVAEFVALAESVVANNREMIEMELITKAEWWPHQAEKINLPTLWGALSGIALAQAAPDQARLCSGCAFRTGTPANQSPSTTLDAAGQCEPGEGAFLCHMKEDAKGRCRTACAGWLQARGRVPS